MYKFTCCFFIKKKNLFTSLDCLPNLSQELLKVLNNSFPRPESTLFSQSAIHIKFCETVYSMRVPCLIGPFTTLCDKFHLSISFSFMIPRHLILLMIKERDMNQILPQLTQLNTAGLAIKFLSTIGFLHRYIGEDKFINLHISGR